MKILVLVPYYLPGYKSGGPVRSVSNLVEHLGDDFEFKIITYDRDLHDHKPYNNVVISNWNLVGKAKVYYTPHKFFSFRHLIRLIKSLEYDVIYLNSFFHPYFTIQLLFARRFNLLPDKPIVIAPRGEFSEGAINLKKVKKALYVKLAKLIGLYEKLIWQASSIHEKNDIKRVMGRIAEHIFIAPNLPPSFKGIELKQREYELDNSLRVIFLSRISPKKNLEFALKVLSKINFSVIFDIYGPIEDQSYWEKCKLLMDDVNHKVLVRYQGSVRNEDVIDTFSRYDLFFFPSHGENFGHVILESMLAGTPVLLSDTTPWRNLEMKGVGWDFSLLDESEFIRALKNVMRMKGDKFAYQEWRNSVFEFASKKAVNKRDIRANQELFRDVYRRGYPE